MKAVFVASFVFTMLVSAEAANTEEKPDLDRACAGLSALGLLYGPAAFRK